MAIEKVYELTTNEKDGFSKWYVKGINSDEEARQIAKKAFGKYFSKTLITHYDNHPSKYYGDKWKKEALTKAEFIKQTKEYRK